MSEQPLVSVVMSVYNGDKYLEEAIDSILTQTYENFEFIIVNDCSTDNSLNILEEYVIKDERIKILNNKENKKLPASLNRGIKSSLGKYIIRMDADDISLPHRFETQVNYMEKNNDVVVCGSAYETFGTPKSSIWKPLLNHAEIFSKLFFNSVIGHPTAIIRKDIFNTIQYNEDLSNAQDYKLWSEAVFLGKLSNLGEVLLKYRRHEKAQGVKNRAVQINTASNIRLGLLKKLNLLPSESEMKIHNAISENENEYIIDKYNEAVSWLEKLKIANEKKSLVDIVAFNHYINKKIKSIKPTLFNRLKYKLFRNG